MALRPCLKVMITKFLKGIKNRLDEVMAHFDPEGDEEYMFAYLWGLHEAHRFLTPIMPDVPKNQENAERYRVEGNRLYNAGEFEAARSMYNRGILLAPHPRTGGDSMQIDLSNRSECSFNGTEDIDSRSVHEDYETLALCYANRSAVHMELTLFDEVLRDIDLAYRCGYPDETKLMKRKVRCMWARGKDGKISKSESKASKHVQGRPRESTFHERFILYQQGQMGGHHFTKNFRKTLLSESEIPIPRLGEANSHIPTLSAAVNLEYTPERGRHLVAARNIQAGETLLVENSYCSSLKETALVCRCCICCVRTVSPLPCPTCSMVMFCSEECRDTGIHQQECEVLPALAAFSADTPSILAYRILMKLTFHRLKELLPVLKAEKKTLPPEMLGFGSAGSYDATEFRAVYHLCTNKHLHNNKQLLGRCVEAFIVTKLLERSRRFFVNTRGEPVFPSEEDIILTGSTLVTIVMALRCNIFSVKDLQVSYNQGGDVTEANVGSKLLPTMSLVNHSCDPSAMPSFGSDPTSLRATRFIPEGEEITTYYGYRYYEKDTAERRKHLLLHYHFECSCEACENDWPDKSKFEDNIMIRCCRCSETVEIKVGECAKCMENYKPVDWEVKEAMDKNKKIGKKIMRAAEAFGYTLNSMRFLETNSKEDKDVISKVLELMHKHVILPCKLYHEAQEAMQIYLTREGKFMYVIPDKKDKTVNSLSKFYWPLIT